jgi:DNA-binding HxlR family transcriptional regulator
MPKNYAQACPVAKALELVGDRWTLLIVRDLRGCPGARRLWPPGAHGLLLPALR